MYNLNHKPLSRERQNELFAKLDDLCPDRLQRDFCIPDNCKQVISEIASHFNQLVQRIARANEPRMGRLELDDLIQEGQIGLVRGIWKFDNSLGLRVSTYVSYWINQSIGRLIGSHSYDVYIPTHAGNQWRKILTLKKTGKIPDCETVAKVLDISVEQAQNILSRDNILTVSSLDKDRSFNEDETINYYGVISDDIDFDYEVDINLLSKLMEKLLDNELTWREEMVLRMRFGINDSGAETVLESIGNRFGFTRERARQIEGEAMDKLRDKVELREFL